jgi:integrase/recombinase XerD
MNNEEAIENFCNWLATKGRSQTTIKQYRGTLKKFFFEYLGNKNHTDITKFDVDGFIQWKALEEVRRHQKKLNGRGNGRLAEIQGTLKATSINTYLSPIKKFYSYLGNNDLSDNIELAKVPRWKPQIQNIQPIIDFFEKANYQDIKDLAEKAIRERKTDSESNIKQFYIDRDALAVFVMFNTGIRVGEEAKLQKDDFYHNKKRNLPPIMTVDGKTGKRTIKISPLVYERITDYCQEYNIKDYLFCNNSGGALSVNSLKTYIWNIFRMGLEIKGHAHDLRHAYATFMIRMGENPKKVQLDLGHSSLNTTSGYIDVAEGENVNSKNPIDYMKGDKK